MNGLFIIAPLSLTAIGIIAGCVLIGLVFVLSGAFSGKGPERRSAGICTPSRYDTLTGAYTETRPRRFYHINVKQLVKRREYVDIE